MIPLVMSVATYLRLVGGCEAAEMQAVGLDSVPARVEIFG